MFLFNFIFTKVPCSTFPCLGRIFLAQLRTQPNFNSFRVGGCCLLPLELSDILNWAAFWRWPLPPPSLPVPGLQQVPELYYCWPLDIHRGAEYILMCGPISRYCICNYPNIETVVGIQISEELTSNIFMLVEVTHLLIFRIWDVIMLKLLSRLHSSHWDGD